MSGVEIQKTIVPGLLRPYISLMFLECTSDREQHAFAKLLAFMKEARQGRSRSTYNLVRTHCP